MNPLQVAQFAFYALATVVGAVWTVSKILHERKDTSAPPPPPPPPPPPVHAPSPGEAVLIAEMGAVKATLEKLSAKLDSAADHGTRIEALERDILAVREKHHAALNTISERLLALLEKLTERNSEHPRAPRR